MDEILLGVQIIYILFLHWLADFVLQTKSMGMGKSSSNIALTKHVTLYTFVVSIGVVFILRPYLPWIFYIVTFISHWVIDYYTSRWTKKLREEEIYYGFPSFFSVLGLDQWFHQLQLIATFLWLKTW